MSFQTRHIPLNAFLAYLQFEKRYSVHTITAYSNDLIQFFDFIAIQYDGMDYTAITGTMVRSWLASMKEEELTGKTLNRKISSLKSFYKYQIQQGHLVKSPMETVISPKISKRLPSFIAENDMEQLFLNLSFAEGWKGYTEKMVIQLFYATGMRLSELIQCKENQVDLSKKIIKVLGKGNKERILPLSPELALELKKYIAQKPAAANGNAHLFVNENGKALQPKAVYTFVKFYLSQVTTLQKKSPHVLRHSFATHLMNNGADLNAVKELLGHSSLAATQVYTHNTIEKLKEVFSKAHPKA
ncbi:MAG: tyrosine-type recombinase/integrase [Bacteroidetes bacterium]|nr:tyrosine-type recombinase/integrase [Bacteroidota bacterium]